MPGCTVSEVRCEAGRQNPVPGLPDCQLHGDGGGGGSGHAAIQTAGRVREAPRQVGHQVPAVQQARQPRQRLQGPGGIRGTLYYLRPSCSENLRIFCQHTLCVHTKATSATEGCNPTED